MKLLRVKFIGTIIALCLVKMAIAGTWAPNNFVYRPSYGESGTTSYNNFTTGLTRIDTRLGYEVWVGDPNYGTTLSAVVAAIGTSKATLHLTRGTYNLTSNLTIPANITLKPERGAIISIADGRALTIRGDLEAGPFQVFSWTGTGTVRELKQAIPDWFIDPSSTDDTAGVQKCLDVCTNVVFARNYNVSHITISGGDKHVNFNGFWLIANSDTPGNDSLLEFTGISCTLYDVRLNCKFKPLATYKCALHWHSGTIPSQYNKIFGLSIYYAVRGMVYGSHPGTTSVPTAQSENVVFGYHAWGVQNPFYGNQSQGYIFFDTPIFNCHANEWASGFSYAEGQAFENVEGYLLINRGEVIKSQSNLGYAATLGGEVDCLGLTFETACPILIKNGVKAKIRHGSNGTMTVNARNYFEVEDGAIGSLELQDVPIKRVQGIAGISASVVVNAPNAPNFLVRLINCHLINWRWTRAYTSVMPVTGCLSEWINTIFEVTDPPLAMRAVINTINKPNLLKEAGADFLGLSVQPSNIGPGDSSGGWTVDGESYGSGLYSKGQVVDNPPGYLKTLEYYSPGSCLLRTASGTSGIKVIPNQYYYLSGYFKGTGGNSRIYILFYDVAGAVIGEGLLVDNQINDSWQKHAVLFRTPANAAFMAVGLQAADGSIARATDIRVHEAF
ncbi:MAG: hypothetical protein AB1424_05680 [Thermodesulfobacteriota bacterium]